MKLVVDKLLCQNGFPKTDLLQPASAVAEIGNINARPSILAHCYGLIRKYVINLVIKRTRLSFAIVSASSLGGLGGLAGESSGASGSSTGTSSSRHGVDDDADA